MKISKSNEYIEEYCSTIVRIGETYPIEGKDRIVKTLVNGLSIVIGKDDFKPGDIAVYCANETVLNGRYLHINSLYSNKKLNADNTITGYISNNGRVRAIKLGGVPSYGILLDPDSIARFVDEPVEDVIKYLEEHLGEDFDEIDDERFIQVYLPVSDIVEPECGNGMNKINKKLKRFKMLIDGSFSFNYHTMLLAKHFDEFSPYDKVFISNKLHGTSAIFSNILTLIPTNWFKRMIRRLLCEDEYDKAYNIVYSSRKVIQNAYINANKGSGYYSSNVYGYWAKKLKDLIPEDYTLYCEIVGFTPNGEAIQVGYDYGCSRYSHNKSKLMVYRITVKGKELDIPDVIKFGKSLKKALGREIIEYPLLYEGTLKDLYPDVPIDEHWHGTVLELLKKEKRFGMEELESLCLTMVPREGIVIRKADDPLSEAWKLKSDKFLLEEGANMDKGKVGLEMIEEYYNEDN